MRTLSNAAGTEIRLYEQGDLVRLTRSEGGALNTAKAGDWGLVTRVHPCGALDIKLGGYCRAKDALMIRAVAVPVSKVEPCDRNGRPMGSDRGPVWNTRHAF